MSSLSFMDMLKLTFKVLEFKFEQSKLTTSLNTVVKLNKGAVKGVRRHTVWGDSYHSFERIPYAKPPLGDLRFKAPEPVEPWSTILDCSGPAEKPLQANVLFRKYKGSEDCLYLNVFTRDIAPERLRPVMVWIYGGGFQIGEATRDMYSPDFFMSKDVVLVTIAYRLGVFGFLSLKDESLNVPGNAGLKDQILSLKWVQENIRAFGGDPNNVTLFGESAGGASTHICVLSEQSKGLIHKAIVMSGSALCPWAQTPPKSWGYRLASKLGYNGEEKDSAVLEFLKSAKGPDMVKAAPQVLDKYDKHHRILFAFGPTIEPYVTEQCIMSEDPYELLKKSWSNDIPIIIGGTSFEGLLFHPEVTRRPATLKEVGNCKNLLPPAENWKELDSEIVEEYALKLKRTYFGQEECRPETMMNFLDLNSYREFWHPIYRTIRARLQYATAPTYVYRFDLDSKEGNAIRNILCGRDMQGVCHGDDMCYIFYAVYSYRAPKDSIEYRTTRTMVDIWTSFAATSDPNCETLEDVEFKALAKNETVKCLNISDQIEYIELPELEKIEVWNSFYSKNKL